MDQELKKLLEDFKKYTLECINSLNNEDYDALDNFILKRQEILSQISKIDCSPEECRKIVDELDILSHQKILSDIIISRQKELRDKIDNTEKKKSAANSYNNLARGAVIFSKKL
ncbi:MAG: DUF725 domain-containing protein [Bacillota bacterium]|nr:DUF725 domain-containing protein [Bacillota bacterium]